MPTCYAKGCRNSNAFGVKMNFFPKNPQRRALWTSICKKSNATTYKLPNDYSALCEYHFAADMWEKTRTDGKKKLKLTAVPSIFGDLVLQVDRKNKNIVSKPYVPAKVGHQNSIMVHTNPQTKGIKIWTPSGQSYKMLLVNGSLNEALKSKIIANSKASEAEESDEVTIIGEKNTSSLLLNNNVISCCTADATSEVSKNPINANDDTSNNKMEADNDSDTDSFIDKNFEPVTDEELEESEEDYENFEPITILNEVDPLEEDKPATNKTNEKCNKCERFKKLWQNSRAKKLSMKIKYKQTCKTLMRKIQLLEDKVNVLECNSLGIHRILNEDQIDFLGKRNKKVSKWSDQTLEKSEELRQGLGVKGYKLLLQNNWPLPTLRTLRKKRDEKKKNERKMMRSVA